MRQLLLLRHGQTAWNLEGRWQGWLDVELDEVGLDQARRRAAWIRDLPITFTGVASSPLLRALATARIVADALGIVDVRTDPGLHERHGGEWQGFTTAEISERFADEFAALRRGDLDCPPGGESTVDMLARLEAALADVDANLPPGPVIVVTHGGIARAMAEQAGADSSSVLANVGGMWIDYAGGTMRAGDPLPPLPDDPAVRNDPIPVAPEVVATTTTHSGEDPRPGN